MNLRNEEDFLGADKTTDTVVGKVPQARLVSEFALEFESVDPGVIANAFNALRAASQNIPGVMRAEGFDVSVVEIQKMFGHNEQMKGEAIGVSKEGETLVVPDHEPQVVGSERVTYAEPFGDDTYARDDSDGKSNS